MFFQELARLEQCRIPFVLATVVEVGGSTPRELGAHMIVRAEEIFDTLGGGAIEHEVIRRCRLLLQDPRRNAELMDVDLGRDLKMACGGRMKVFMQKFEPTPQVWLFGAGHTGTVLAEMARLAGWSVHVVDERPEWADPQRFHRDVQIHLSEPELFLKEQLPAPEDYVAILTYGHLHDEAILRRLLPHPLRYLGLMGSRGKWVRFCERLIPEFGEAAVARVHCPMGLDIKAQTPQEIAVSVIGQMVAERRG